ncbi:MAG: VirB8/TrbF family protein [Alphaproteobacteria bacterium]|nr:VirB8/TrbF family protein [Alphaproteobacteria bacterium]
MRTVEPPALMSKIMTFVFAAALATAVVLVATLANIMPLNRTQIFFLTSQPLSNTEIRLKSFSVTDSNIEIYKENFIREYIRMRNEIIPQISAMHARWCRRDCPVGLWSAPDVFAEFARTGMWLAVMEAAPNETFPATCRVEFIGNIDPYRPADGGDDTMSSEHLVRFRHFCFDNAGHEESKDYTIVIGIKFQPSVKWSDRLENPLGILVYQYRMGPGLRDPLDRHRAN